MTRRSPTRQNSAKTGRSAARQNLDHDSRAHLQMTMLQRVQAWIQQARAAAGPSFDNGPVQVALFDTFDVDDIGFLFAHFLRGLGCCTKGNGSTPQ